MSKLEEQMKQITDTLINMKNYDTEDFVNQLYYWVRDLNFFYSTLVPKQNNDKSKTFYQVAPSKLPKEGQVAYFNLRKGYPKELYDGHFCYILKSFKYKFLVIPGTSVKEDSAPIDENFEVDIYLKDFTNNLVTRLQVTDIRVVDLQRLNTKRNIYDIDESKITISEINKKVKNIIF